MVGMQPVTPPATRSTRIGRSSRPDDIGPGPSASAVRMPEGAAPAHRPLPADPPDPRLFRFLWGMTGDVAVAEELERMKSPHQDEKVQEAARQALRKIFKTELGKKPPIEIHVLRV